MTFLNSILKNSKKHDYPFAHWEYSDALSEESINEIQMNIEKLGNHLNSYLTYHEKLGNSISTVVNQYNVTNKEFKKIDKDITKLTSNRSSIGIEMENIDKPVLEE